MGALNVACIVHSAYGTMRLLYLALWPSRESPSLLLVHIGFCFFVAVTYVDLGKHWLLSPYPLAKPVRIKTILWPSFTRCVFQVFGRALPLDSHEASITLVFRLQGLIPPKASIPLAKWPFRSITHIVPNKVTLFAEFVLVDDTAQAQRWIIWVDSNTFVPVRSCNFNHAIQKRLSSVS